MSKPLQVDFDLPIPLFPLPNCVLLPHATIPLHIFEPSYREMVHDVLDSHSLIAMATFEGNDWKEDYAGKPPIRPIVCVGYVVRHQKMPSDRYNMLLQGVCRARIVKEVVHAPYRMALLEATEQADTMEIDLGEQRQRLEHLLSDDLLKELSSVSAIRNWLSREIPTAVLVDLAIMTVCDDLEQRYRMLTETDATKRAHWLEKNLRSIRKTLSVADRIGPSQTDDGLCLN